MKNDFRLKIFFEMAFNFGQKAAKVVHVFKIWPH